MMKGTAFRSGLSQSPREEEPDFIVLYSGHDQKYFAEAYLDAMDIVVNQLLDKGRMDPRDDTLTLPLLSLCVNATEFSLKFFVVRYDEHRRNDHCTAIPIPPGDFQKILRTHDLKELFEVAQVINPAQGLHHVSDLADCGALVDDLTSFGVSSESTRYGNQPSGRRYPLHEAQTYLYPDQLRAATNAVCGRLLCSEVYDTLHMCSTGDYKRRRLDELREAATELDKIWDALVAFVSKPTINASRQELRRRLDRMDDRALALVVMSLYFSGPPTTVEDLGYFERLHRDGLRSKILERAHLCEKARAGLESHIKDVSSRVAERRST